MAAATLFDNHGRQINYLRLAVTDRCNLRCFYCMPENGIHYLQKKDVLTFAEIERLVNIVAQMGITKIRITGGEPFVRTDLMPLLSRIIATDGIEEVHITTNGTLTAPHIPALKQLGIASVNLSMDTLDASRYRMITRRDDFCKTQTTLESLLESEIPVKINAVVMENKNIEDIIPLIELTRLSNVSVRFIEEMPFNGEGSHYPSLSWTYKRILEFIRSEYSTLEKIADEDHATASRYKVPGFKGNIGIIAAFSRTFCGSCNRIRMTAGGELKTCLYDDGVLNVKDLMRKGVTDEYLKGELALAFGAKPKDGFEAERARKVWTIGESMATIGG